MGTKRHDEIDFTHRVLANNDVGWLSLSSEDGPYLVPVNYFWHGGQILIHTSYEGRKIDCLKADDRVCFGVGRASDALAPHAKGGCHYPFESVLVFGKARLLTETEEKLEPLQTFLNAYDPKGEFPPLTAESVSRTLLIIIEPERITGMTDGGGNDVV